MCVSRFLSVWYAYLLQGYTNILRGSLMFSWHERLHNKRTHAWVLLHSELATIIIVGVLLILKRCNNLHGTRVSAPDSQWEDAWVWARSASKAPVVSWARHFTLIPQYLFVPRMALHKQIWHVKRCNIIMYIYIYIAFYCL